MINSSRIFTQLAFVSILIILFSIFCPVAVGETDNSLSHGRQLYENKDYRQAMDIFQQAILSEPDNSVYHHWLAKCYGRQAENSGIFEAYDLSKKTRVHLEKAVELDNTNIDAMLDLMEFYQQAPGFLGGGADKAAGMCQKIRALDPDIFNKPENQDIKLPEKC